MGIKGSGTGQDCVGITKGFILVIATMEIINRLGL